MPEQGPDPETASQMLAAAYAPGSQALRSLHGAMREAGRAGGGLIRSIALDTRTGAIANPNGTFSLAARAMAEDGTAVPFAVVARKEKGGWSVDGAVVAGRDGKTAFKAPARDGLEDARSQIAKARSAMDESSRLGAPAPDSSLNAHNDAKLAASQAEPRSRAPEREPQGGAGNPRDPIDLAADRSGRRRGGLLSIIATAAEILEAIDPRAVASNPTSATLRIFASAARLPNGNSVMGAETPLAGVAASLDGRKPLHEVHLSIDAMRRTLARDARSPSGAEVGDDSLGSLLQSLERTQAREAAAPAMERAMSGKGAAR